MNRAPAPAASLGAEHKRPPGIRPGFSSGQAAPQHLIEAWASLPATEHGVEGAGWDPNRDDRDLGLAAVLSTTSLGLGRLDQEQG